MNELHKQLRNDAEVTLDALVTEIQGVALKIAAENGIEPTWLLRLALDKRTTSLHKKVIAKLVEVREAELLDIHRTPTIVTNIGSAGEAGAPTGGNIGG